MDELLAFRLGDDVIAFDMASRRIRRLAETTTWSGPRNASERAIKDRAELCLARICEAKTHRIWLSLSKHIWQLQEEGLRATGHRHLRMEQGNRQYELERAFERLYGPQTLT
jgi:hypothetical protein